MAKRHRVKEHTREGRRVRTYMRGSGSRRTVRPKRPMSRNEEKIEAWWDYYFTIPHNVKYLMQQIVNVGPDINRIRDDFIDSGYSREEWEDAYQRAKEIGLIARGRGRIDPTVGGDVIIGMHLMLGAEPRDYLNVVEPDIEKMPVRRMDPEKVREYLERGD